MKDEKEPTKWLGNTICDVCKTDLHKVFWFSDCRVKNGPWALLCSVCHQMFALHKDVFGPGIGQKYDGKTFNKLEG